MTGTAVSEKAFSYALNLTCEMTALGNVAPAVHTNQLLALAGLNAGQLSEYIDVMQKLVWNAKKAKPFVPAVLAYTPPAGQYLVNGVHYNIKKSKKHGGMLVYTGDGCGYVGALAAPKCADIAAALDSAEKAKAAVLAYAKETGKCGVCNTTLTDPKSIAAGIGPVCAKKYS